MAVKTLKFKLYNKKRYIKQYDAQCEILRKIWNLCVALYEYCEFDNNQKYAIENGRVYSSPKKLEYYLDIWKRFFDKYPEEYEKLFFIIDKGVNIGQKMCIFNTQQIKGIKKKPLSYFFQDIITMLKKDRELGIIINNDNKVNSVSVQNVTHRFGNNLQAHINKKRQKLSSSVPEFKHYGDYNGIKFGMGTVINVCDKYIRLPLFEKIKVFNSDYLNKITELTNKVELKNNEIKITKNSDGLYLLITLNYIDGIDGIDDIENTLLTNGSIVGIDMGVNKLLALSDGTFYENGRFLKNNEQQIKVLQRKLIRKTAFKEPYQRVSKKDNKTYLITREPLKEQSSAYRKAKEELSKLHLKVARQRKEYYHEIVNDLANKYVYFVFEDLKIKNMTKSVAPKQDEQGRYIKTHKSQKSGLNRSILDSALGMFTTMLVDKVGSDKVFFVNPAYTSQTCNCCGNTDSKNRKKQEQFKCVSCGHEDNADTNASKNILKIHTSGEENIKNVFKKEVKELAIV